MKRSTIIVGFITAFILLLQCDTHAQTYIRSITYDKRDVFDSTQRDWFFAGKIVNSLHTMTRDYVIDDELLFSEGDEVNYKLIEETERNLRRTGLFSRVVIRTLIDSIETDSADIIILTQDQWSTTGAVLFGAGGGVSNTGGRVDEFNLVGTGIGIGAQGLYRTENDIGWQGSTSLRLRRFLRTEYNVLFGLDVNRVRTMQSLTIDKPFRTLDTRHAYQVSAINNFGDDFLYTENAPPSLLPFRTQSISAMFARNAGNKDQYFVSALVSAENIRRVSPLYRQAFDNTGKLLVSLGSLRQEFIKTNGVDGYDVQDVPIGAWGQAVLGYLFPMNSMGERMFYVGGLAEQSGMMLNNDLYLFGSVQAASGFTQSTPRYTYLESQGIGHYRLSKYWLVAGRFRQQTAFNWTEFGFRQLVLDNDAGLRGYPVNTLTGDNRFVANLELRSFPELEFWFFRLSGALFYDIGTVWNQGQQLPELKMRHAIGLGLRFHNLKSTGGSAILRFDIAYNPEFQRFNFVISSDQLFSGFGRHFFRAPSLFGAGIDSE
jgi:hypothetical protein